MRRAVLVPVLLTAAVGPYLAGDNWDGKVPTKLTALVNQIESFNSSSDRASSNSSSATQGGGSSFGSNSGWSQHESSSSGTKTGDASFGSSTHSSYSSSSGGAIAAQTVSGSKTVSSDNSSSNSFSSSTANLAAGAAAHDPEKDPTYDFHEILRFDVSPRWVVSHWPRVTTVLAEMELEGLRVPLVTGTKSDDIAGSLTYYFDKQHAVQRLTFHGYTGDDRRLVQFACQSYGLKKFPTLGAGLYMIQWNGTPRSALRLTLMPVVRHSTPNMKQEVMFEINRPRSHYGMSAEFEALLKADRENGRW